LINTADFSDHKDLTTVKGDPLGSANVLFSPDSRFAFYASSADNLVFQHDLTTSAVKAQIPLGAQPATMAMTPDGKTIAVVDFLSNKIELLTDAYVLDAAKFISSPD